MKAYLGIKFHPDNRNRSTIEAISQALANCGMECQCIRRDVEQWGAVDLGTPQALMAKTFEVIQACDLTIIELSEKGVGLGIEAGYAHAIGKRVFTIAKIGSDVSTTLAGISSKVYLYDKIEDLQHTFSTWLTT
ncbi:nucleoside 2-deoxyribosyltransferase [Chloroflexi bacterium TSY]|nr:nucleoside 2-deoxyribosyltransferase [Chloroflexi bacterium TSY]